ncbi:two-component sensor histidine kinase [Winogradskyella sp. PC-19]|uniref:sensor histidine kinase n=1 Tax=unclassified Winogradskyella TaxID=2615021 RepID=UPI000B3C13E2|nr:MULTISPECIES: HAMP domain-containing sensor histidine kinase [unclassified Winogradskyella]ARV09368.1 two-component sensor histidine kinase [Winogradskyella sp. PC-19]RZN76456.1 MAG: HAMP domain-containing histidine kinase [Winogradskyella sp.]
MNDKRYRYILYVITVVIIATIGIQIYWNYKNYLTNKQQLINDVQVSLDKAVDDYYANLAEETTMALSFDETPTSKFFEEESAFNKILENIDQKNGKLKAIDSNKVSDIKGLSIFRGFEADSIMDEQRNKNNHLNADSFKLKVKELKQANPNIKIGDFKMLTTQVMISISNDTLNLKVIDTLLKNELNRKKIDIDYNLDYEKPKNKIPFSKDIIIVEADTTYFKDDLHLSVFSESTFLPKEGDLKVDFANETKVILRRMLGGIGISGLLVLSVIACLFYLLKIINQQKQLAEVKNDLISNITHEFKTPIATIGAALEGINSFNIIDDKEKTKKYIDMSSGQLSKLNLMVEKLLETATLDSESLELNKEEIDIIALLTSLSSRYQTHNADKTIQTSFKVESLVTKVDIFHFENAINNILDNAIKYGGDIIIIDLTPSKNSFNINISDNGTSLTKASNERVFEKFYRVPKGNKHDVKGFGIGLYYTKSIIEKHDGTITLDLNNKLTTFKIELPNG